MILDAVQAVMPSFVARVERPDRGGEWVAYLRGARARRPSAGSRGSGSTATARRGRRRPVGAPAARRRRRGRPAGRAAVRGGRRRRGGRARSASPRCGADERAALLADLVGERANRRHRPGRGFEALRYRFEIVSDYGAFRDLQRHRMLTVQWQRADARPRRRRARGGRRRRLRRRLPPRARASRATSTSGWSAPGREREAPYALCLGYRIRYVLDLNAREAMQLIELRSGREGHPGYRAVAHEMHRQIAAVHPAVAGAMTHVDRRPSRGWSGSSARCARRPGSTL